MTNFRRSTASPHASKLSASHNRKRVSVAIVGGGAAGMAAARTLLAAGAHVVIFESATQLGGNCFGVQVSAANGKTYQVDAGVSDFNRSTFSELSSVIDELGLKTHPINSDLSVHPKMEPPCFPLSTVP